MTLTMVTVFSSSCKKEPIAPIDKEVIFDEELITKFQKEISDDIEYIFTSNTANKTCFVKLCYNSYLGRCGEQSGINYWIDELEDASINKIASVALDFTTAQEVSDKWENDYTNYLSSIGINNDQVNKSTYIIYRGLLNREPDVHGGMHWTNYTSSHRLENAIKAIMLTPEFLRRLKKMSAECSTYDRNCD